MLELIIPDSPELFDERTNRFLPPRKGGTIRLEHSLVSISKWESKYHKPYLSAAPKTLEEIKYYVKCMTITQNVPDGLYENLTDQNMCQIYEYIDDSMTASTVKEHSKSHSNPEQVTSELIYYWMIAFNIPPQYEKWHLNRLMMLIKICGAKNEKPTKKSRNQTMSEYRALNAARRKASHSKG